MAYFITHGTVLAADGITIQIGNYNWSLNSNIIIYLIVAAIIGFIAEYLVGWRLPFGFIGAVIAAVIGIWLMTQVIVVNGIGDIYFSGVPLFRALIGSILLVGLWHLVTYKSWGGRSKRRYSYRSSRSSRRD